MRRSVLAIAFSSLLLVSVSACDDAVSPTDVAGPDISATSSPAFKIGSESFFTGAVYRFDYFGAVLLGNSGGGLLSLHTPYMEGVYHWWSSLGACDEATEIRTGIQQRVTTEHGMLRLSKFDKFHVLVYRWNGEPITCDLLNNVHGNLVAEGIVDAVSVNHLDSSCPGGDTYWNWNVGGNVTDVSTGQTLGYGAHRTHVRMPDCTWRQNLSRKGPWLAGKGWSGNSAH